MVLQDPEADNSAGIGALVSQMPAILWQRRWFIIVPTVLGLIAATVTAFVLPLKYESSAVMLVKSAALPEDIIGRDSAETIDRRIEAIRQQIINRPSLLGLIETVGLYEKEQRSKPLSEIIDEMRQAISLEPEKLDTGPGTRDDTIAVRLAFVYENPAKAQAVTQKLMERIVEVNSTVNSDQAEQTVDFLTQQQADVRQQITAVEGELAALNARYGGVLAAGGAAIVSSNTGSYDMQIASLEREISQLRSQRATLASADTRDPAVIAAEAQLAALRATYSDNHPDVALARRRLEEAKALAKGNVAKIPTETIDAQIAINERQIAQLRAMRASDDARTNAVLAERARAPSVQQQADQIEQRLKGLYSQYDAISERLLSARASMRADEEQMGQRLIIVDPPVVPDSPASPNRPLIVALGAAGGLALGLLLAFATELFLRPIRDPAAIRRLTGARPLALIPLMEPLTPAGTSRRWPAIFQRKKRALDEGLQA